MKLLGEILGGIVFGIMIASLFVLPVIVNFLYN